MSTYRTPSAHGTHRALRAVGRSGLAVALLACLVANAMALLVPGALLTVVLQAVTGAVAVGLVVLLVRSRRGAR